MSPAKSRKATKKAGKRAAPKKAAAKAKGGKAKAASRSAKPSKAAKPGKRSAAPGGGNGHAHCAATDPFGDPCQNVPRRPSKYCVIHSYLDR